MIDWNRVTDLKQTIGAKAFAEVVTLFLDEADQAMTSLATASVANEMKDHLHTLKGAALTLGFTDLSEVAQICESRAEAGDSNLPLADVQAIYTRSRAAFVLKLAEMTA